MNFCLTLPLEQMEKLENLAQKVLDASFNAIVVLKAIRNEAGEILDLQFVLANKSSEKLLKRSVEELIGNRYLLLYPRTKDIGVFDMIINVINNGTPKALEFFYDEDRLKNWFKAVYVKFQDGVIICFDDITDRKNAEIEVQQLNSELEKRIIDRTQHAVLNNEKLKKKNEELDKFAYLISHDLKAPLKAIKPLANFIKEDYKNKPLDEEGLNLVSMIQEKVNLMDDLISGVLESARTEAKAKELIDVNLLVNEVIDNFSPSSKIQFYIQKNLPKVICHKLSLIRIFQNLIGNAIKYIDKPHGIIKIGSTMYENQYQFCIEDNGIGIKECDQKKIFDEFQILHNNPAIESSGLGLAIVKKLVEENKGKIWVASKPVHGSTFYFTIPIEELPT